jgi:AraC-like DNA-binding protein
MGRYPAGEVRVYLSDTAGPGEAAAPSPRDPTPLVPFHAHDTYTLCWVLDGRSVLAFPGRALALDPSRACIIRPGELHHLRPAPGPQYFRSLWWRLAPRGITVYEVVFDGRRREGELAFATLGTAVVRAIESVVRELELGRPYHDLLVRAALLDLSARTLRALVQARVDGSRRGHGERHPPSIRGFVQHVHTHYRSDLSLASLAAGAGLTPSYVTAQFRRHTGRTLMAYVNDLRHREARSLLRNTDRSVVEIGRAVGYADPYLWGATIHTQGRRAWVRSPGGALGHPCPRSGTP